MTGRGDCGEVPGEESVGTRRGQELRTISHEERVRREGAGRAWNRKEALPLVHNPCADGMTQKGEREAGLRGKLSAQHSGWADGAQEVWFGRKRRTVAA